MTGFEKELRAMLTDSEMALLDRYLGATETRDGAIASLVARRLRQYAEDDVIDLFHDKG
ncbi:hypothetical protein UFOVP395_110 [uncultured Caudovirales phage]|uniref:Uncharacterized protein n=1 Tax=uncultured Caudovirales phage TaxID=2100421 RepID=A0A6J5M1G7_9CAUD|nr:hypothetical protein UFOVP395_110 [uncultured Caudovirales phage]